METLEKILSEHAFFKGLEKEYLQMFVECASNVRFEAGSYIFREGEDANKFFLLRAGKVALEIYVPVRGSIAVQTLEEGDILGWSWFVPPYKWHFDARVLQLTRAIALDGTCLRKKCESDPELGYAFLKRFAEIITQRLEATRLQLLDIYAQA